MVCFAVRRHIIMTEYCQHTDVRKDRHVRTTLMLSVHEDVLLIPSLSPSSEHPVSHRVPETGAAGRRYQPAGVEEE